MRPNSKYCNAKQAAKYLNIKIPTLYSYVSRGLIRSENTSSKKRDRRYLWEDVEQVKQRSQIRKHPEQASKTDLFWGRPVLESKITLITVKNLYYRGQSIKELVEKHTFEEVVSLLWSNDLAKNLDRLQLPPSFLKRLAPLSKLNKSLEPVNQLQALIPHLASADPASMLLQKSNIIHSGIWVMSLLTQVICNKITNQSIAEQLAKKLTPNRAKMSVFFNALLIVCADHELNTSSFTARCVASTHANPYAAINAGIAALSGSKHGGSIKEIVRIFNEIETSKNLNKKPGEIIQHYCQIQNHIPGFAHPLYPNGDPRADILLKYCETLFPKSKSYKLTTNLSKFVYDKLKIYPSVDYAIATFCYVFQQPAEIGLALFTLSRISGFTAHIIEQLEMNKQIRPRGSYIGIQPSELK